MSKKIKPKLAKCRAAHGWSFSKEEDCFIKICAGKKPLSWIAEQLQRPKASVITRAHLLKCYKLLAAETVIKGRKERAINRFSLLKGNRVQLSTSGWARHTGETVVLGFKRKGYVYAAKMVCEAANHEFLAPWFRSGNYPRSCPKCIVELGGQRIWLLMLAISNRFSLSIDEYLKKRNKQMDAKRRVLCAICFSPEKSKLHALDHDHNCCSSYVKSCGKCTRQFLCQICNMIIGLIEKENPTYNCSPAHRRYLNKWNRKLRR